MNDWTSEAACRDMDVSVFFPARGQMFRVQVARAVCQTCPVRNECLHEALSSPFPVVGVWAGLTEHERTLLARRRHAS